MLPEILRYLINEFGRWTLIQAAKMRRQGMALEQICSDLGVPDDHVENIVQAGGILTRMAAEQRDFEARIIEPV